MVSSKSASAPRAAVDVALIAGAVHTEAFAAGFAAAESIFASPSSASLPLRKCGSSAERAFGGRVLGRASPTSSVLLLAFASSAAAFLPPASQKCFASSSRTPSMVCVRRGILSTHMMAKGRSASRSGSAGEQRRRGTAERTLRVTMDEMHEGMELEGIVRSVKDYGAFIDVGSTTDGLLHIDQMLPCHREHRGNEVIVTASEGEKILVEVANVDMIRGRFALREVSLPDTYSGNGEKDSDKSKGDKGSTGMTVEEAEELFQGIVTGDEEDVGIVEHQAGKALDSQARLEKWAKKMSNKGGYRELKPRPVRSVTEYGVFIDMGGDIQGLLHVSEMEVGIGKDKYGKVLLKTGDNVKVRVLEVDTSAGKVKLSMQAWEPSGGEMDEEAAATLERLNKEAEDKGKSAFTAAWEQAIQNSGQKKKKK